VVSAVFLRLGVLTDTVSDVMTVSGNDEAERQEQWANT
jgi:hypothetical protein